MKAMFKPIFSVLLVCSFLVFPSCTGDNTQIPFVAVDFTININEPAYFNLTAISGYEYVVGGSMGIVVYRNSFNEFTAMDRHSTYRVDDNCQVEVVDDILLEDPCSGSQWLLSDGSLINGPAEVALKQYNTVYNAPFLRIYN